MCGRGCQNKIESILATQTNKSRFIAKLRTKRRPIFHTNSTRETRKPQTQKGTHRIRNPQQIHRKAIRGSRIPYLSNPRGRRGSEVERRRLGFGDLGIFKGRPGEAMASRGPFWEWVHFGKEFLWRERYGRVPRTVN